MVNSSGNSTGIQIRNLFKIFGRSGLDYVDKVQHGMSKTELLEKHGHVLGLKDINIDMPAGSIQVIMGLSGSGKSTLIRHINRLIDPTSGQVLVEGTDVVKFNPLDLREFRRHKTAMVFQKFGLLPHRTVLENTVYGLEVQGLPRAKQVDAAMKWLDRVGLTGFENRYPNQLSGGMQQRVGLARALANDAPILLMDEAFSALDPLIRADMQSVLLDLQKEIRKTIVFITHDLDEALRLGDGIAILRDGEIVQQGNSQDIVLRPADEYIASFVKEVNRGRVVRVASAMAPLRDGDVGSTVSILGEATLEAAAYVFRQNDVDKLTVVDDANLPIGTISLREVMNAMLTTERAIH
ncbi:glycine betaine/L-proline ABC transporter ATP-binding protein [Corticibacterium sp. UT-5YL-CI-8]|nr:glycine betaine/L-proline ABC transporter ATP-binding protein [Tianweitania sp. UT-5YL-CI-8]